MVRAPPGATRHDRLVPVTRVFRWGRLQGRKGGDRSVAEAGNEGEVGRIGGERPGRRSEALEDGLGEARRVAGEPGDEGMVGERGLGHDGHLRMQARGSAGHVGASATRRSAGRAMRCSRISMAKSISSSDMTTTKPERAWWFA